MAGIRVELELADGTFTTRMLRAGQTVKDFHDQVAATSKPLTNLAAAGVNVVRSIGAADVQTKSFMSTLRDVSIVTGLVSVAVSKLTGLNKGWIGDIVRVNMEMERLNFQMRAMSSSANPIREAADTVDYLRKKSLDMPFSLKAITDGFVKMKATGTDPLNGSLVKLADGVAAAGGTDETFKRAILAVSQISGKGVLQMEELRQQMAESMPRAVELMARSMGVSMATLIRQIGTGTVQAKPALEAFYAELERTYGGAARNMMMTFSGQLQKTQTLIQSLQSSGTIKTEFFDTAMRQQLLDLNDFLNSNAAGKMRDQLGNGMAGVVTTLRSVFDGVFNLRNEIGRFATVLAYGFGMKVAISGLMGFIGAIATTRAALVGVGVQFSIASTAQAAFTASGATGATALTRVGLAATAAGSSLKGIAMGAAALAPWIAVISLGVYAAGEYFGVFSNKVQEAYKSLQDFGAESRAQASESIAAYKQQLMDRIAAIEAVGGMTPGHALNQKLEETRTELLGLQRDSATLIQDAGKREDAKVIDRFRGTVETRLAQLKLAYDKDMNAAVLHWDQMEKTAQEKGESVSSVQEQRTLAMETLIRNSYATRLNDLKVFMSEQVEQAKGLGGLELEQAKQRMDMLTGMIADANRMAAELRRPGVETVAKPQNEDKAFEKGQKFLQNLKNEAEGLEAQLDGANGALGELGAMLEAGKYGNNSRENVQALNDEIIATKTLIEAQKIKVKIKKEEDRLYDNGKDNVEKLKADIAGFRAQLDGSNFDVAKLDALLSSGKLGSSSRTEIQKMIADTRALKVEREALKVQVDQMNKSDRMFENGQNSLKAITADIHGMVASLGGANEKVAEMQELLASGKFGSQDQDRVQNLTLALEDTIRAKTALDKIMAGKKTLEDDIEAARQRGVERRLEAEMAASGQIMTEADKIQYKMNNGYYAGFGSSSQINKAMSEVVDAFGKQGIAAEGVGLTIRNNTFGDATNTKIITTTDRLREMSEIIARIGTGLGNVSFDGMQGFGANGMTGANGGAFAAANVTTTADMEAKMAAGVNRLMELGWSRIAASGAIGNLAGESGLRTNARNPGDGSDGSDSIGLAQWNQGRATGLQNFAADKGKSWMDYLTQIEFVDKELRTTHKAAGDALRNAQTPEEASSIFMRKFEVPSDKSMAESGGRRAGFAKRAYDMAGSGPTVDNAARQSATPAFAEEPASHAAQLKLLTDQATASQVKFNEQLKVQQAYDAKTLGVENANKRRDALEELKIKADAASKPVEELGKNYQALLEKIGTGELGPNKDAGAAEYKDLIAAAKELDAVEDKVAAKKKARGAVNNAEESFRQKQIDLNKRAAEAMARIADPDELKSSSAYRALSSDLDEYVRSVEAAEGRTSQASINAATYRDTVLRQMRNTEVTETAAGYAKKTQEIRRGLMTETQSRQAALAAEIAAIDKQVADFRGTEDQKVKIVAAAEAQKAALRQQAAMATDPMARQMQQWGDLQGNLAQASTQWMNGLADGLTGLITGTGDLKGMINGMLKDVVNMGLKYMMSGMSGKGGAGGTSGKSASAAKSMFSKGAVPVHHSGGIIGGRAISTRLASGTLFSDAPKFHTGGILGPKLNRGDVPMIGQEGEGVFTKEQMKAMGGVGKGSNTISISAPITVAGSAGSPEQNDDLAKKMQKGLEETMRSVVVDEMIRQMKPGNMLSKRQ